jgi:hypothetical protein
MSNTVSIGLTKRPAKPATSTEARPTSTLCQPGDSTPRSDKITDDHLRRLAIV